MSDGGLKPCPFCGHAPTMGHHVDDDEMDEARHHYFVECVGNGCIGVVSTMQECGAPEEAAALWNRRSGEGAAREQGRREVALEHVRRVQHWLDQHSEGRDSCGLYSLTVRLRDDLGRTLQASREPT